MSNYTQKSVKERFELELRALLSAEYFDRLPLEDRVDIIIAFFVYFRKICK